MVEIPEVLNKTIQWIGIILIGLGPLFISLGFVDYKNTLTQSAILGIITSGTDVGTFILIRFMLYSPGMVYAGITLPIVGFALILVLKLIVIIPKGEGLPSKEVSSIIGIILALIGAIIAGISLLQWSTIALYGVIFALLPIPILVLLMLMEISDFLWIIGAILVLSGFVTLLILILTKKES